MIAIQLTTTGQWLDMLPDSALRYEMVSGAFDMESIQANVVYPFDFPVAGNEEKLNHTHVIAVNRTTKRYAVAVFVCGVRIFDGNMYVQSVLPTVFSAAIVENNVLIDFPETDIRDLDWADIDVSASGMGAYAGAAISQEWPDVPVNFPLIKAPLCYGENNESNATYLGYVNNYDRANHVFLANDMVADSQPPNNQNALMPWPYLMEIFRQMESFFKVRFTGNILSNADYKKIILSALKLADKGWNRYYCKVTQEAPPNAIYVATPNLPDLLWLEDYVLSMPIEDEDSDNCWDGYKYEIKQKGYHNIKGTLNVDWTVLDPGDDHVVLRISQYASADIISIVDYSTTGHSAVNIDVSYFAAAAGIGEYIVFTLVVENNNVPRVVDAVSGTIEISNASTSALNVFNDTLNVGDYLPEMTAAAFINKVRLLLGGVLYYDTTRRVLELSDFNSVLNSESIDLTDNLVSDDFELQMLEEAEGYSFKWEWGNDDREEVDTANYTNQDEVISRSSLPANALFGSITLVLNEKNYLLSYLSAGAQAWKFLQDSFSDLVIGSGDKTIAPDMAPIRMTFDTNAVVPFVNIPLLSELFGTGTDQKSLRVLSYFGVQQDSDDGEFPFASSGHYHEDGTSLGSIDLDWNGDNGLYAQCWQKWIEFIQNNETMTAKLRIGINEFIQIRNLFSPQDGTKKTRKIRLMNIDFIPEKISVIFTDADTWECEAVLKKKGAVEL